MCVYFNITCPYILSQTHICKSRYCRICSVQCSYKKSASVNTPGSGTNQNERFHRHIKSFFNKSKIGIVLAYALLTHYHNSRIHSQGKVIVRPIVASPFHGLATGIGIVRKNSCSQREGEENGDEHWKIDLTDKQIDMISLYSNSIAKLRMRALEHMKLNQLLTQIFSFQPFEVFSTVHSENLSDASVGPPPPNDK